MAFDDLLRHPAWRAALALLLAAALLLGAEGTPLFDQDEAAYAGFARGMRESGDWVLHGYTWSEMHRKPPLALWLIAASTGLLGEHNWTVRLPGALCIAATILLVATWGGRLLGAARACNAAVVLATSLTPLFGRTALVDPVLLLSSTTATLGLLELLAGRPRRGAAAVGLGLAAGLLAKGPAVVLALGVTTLGLLLLHPARRRLLDPWLLLGLCLAPLPLLAWGALAWRADDGVTVRWMLDWYLLRRAGGQVLGQTGPPGVYLVSFLLFLLPWAGLLPAGLSGLLRGLRAREPAAAALVAWLLGGWLVWELLPSKLPAYALGAYPALALAIAGPLSDLAEGRPARGLPLVGMGLQGLALLALALGLGWAGVTLEPEAPVPGLLLAGAWVLLVGGLAVGGLLAGRLRVGLLAAMGLGPGLLLILWLGALPALRSRLHPTWLVAEAVADLAAPRAPAVLADAWRLPSLPYYLEGQGRPVAVQPTAEVAARALLPGPWVLVLPEAPPALPPDVRVVRIEGFVPDKGVPTTFVVVAR